MSLESTHINAFYTQYDMRLKSDFNNCISSNQPITTTTTSNTNNSINSKIETVENMPFNLNMKSQMGQLLGSGAFGRVFKTMHDNIPRACKVMAPLDENQGLAHTTLRECDAFARFQHPCIVNMHFIEIIDRHVCVWMDLADMDLTQYMNQEPRVQNRMVMAVQVLYCVLSALMYLHKNRVIHRDVKPDNILLKNVMSSDSFQNRFNSCQWSVYLSDLGAIRYHDKVTELTAGMGTKYYRPPEMLTENYTSACDIYTLACSIVHLICGHLPQICQTQEYCQSSDWMLALMVYQKQLGPLMFGLLKSMLHPDPTLRPTAKQCLNHEFFAHFPKISGAPCAPISFPFDYTKRYPHLDRSNLIQWMINIGWQINHSFETLIHSIYLMDDFLAYMDTHMFQQIHPCLDLVAAVSVWLASKFFDGRALQVSEWLILCHDRYTIQQFLDMEEDILIVLKFRLFRRPLPACLRPRDFKNPQQLIEWAIHQLHASSEVHSDHQTVSQNTAKSIYVTKDSPQSSESE